MVKLKNIRKAEGYISASYTPEDTSEEGYIKIRLSDGEVVEQRLTSEDGVTWFYFRHVRKALWEMMEEDEIPEKRTIMWY